MATIENKGRAEKRLLDHAGGGTGAIYNLNRVTQAGEESNWGRGFDYDSYGNMWVDPSTSRTFGIQPAGNTPTSDVYNSNNQITGSNNYDGNGNQVAVNSASASYDAENHVINTTEPQSMGGTVDNYSYDGNGRRVVKILNGTTVVYVYDAFGDLDAEYTNASSSQIASPCYTPCYLTHDYLGSLRLLTDRRGNVVVARHDYLPFGEEIPAGTGGRTAQWGASNDANIPTRFTGQLRDLETGLDYFGARYFGAALGRFTSPDPESASASVFDPQRWNAYSYAVNNPLKFVDRDGEIPLLAATALIGAGVGAVGGAAFDTVNQLIQSGWDVSAINGGEVGAAALGGAVSGGIAGLTLGLIPAPASLTAGYLATTAVVNGGANVVGGIVQREANDALSVPQNDSPTNNGAMAVDFASGAVGGALGTKVAYARYPLPNVRKELALLANSNRRSLRPQRTAAFNQYVNRQAIRNTTAGSVAGTSITNFFTDLWGDLTSFFSQQKKEQVTTNICYGSQSDCSANPQTP